MRILSVTGLFPRSTAPTLGVFIRNRILALRALGAEVRVVAPLPYVPPGPVPARYARLRRTPAQEEHDGIPVLYPRYPMIPKVGTRWQARGYARGIRRVVHRLAAEFRPDLIDAHYLYPDACGAARIAREVGLPYVCSARGSDVQVLGTDPPVAEQIRRALASAAGVIAVSAHLAARMRELGLCDRPVDIVPNGIDRARFHPRRRAQARARLGWPGEGRHLVCVGHLVPTRCIDLLVRAMAHPDAPAGTTLHLVGDGAGRAGYERLARDLGVAERIVFEGVVDHEHIPDWFAASDGSIQLNRSAGSPNAVLESLACRTPVLASDIPAMREAMSDPADGIRVPLEVPAVAAGMAKLLEAPAPHGRVRSWEDVGREVLAVFDRALAGGVGKGGV